MDNKRKPIVGLTQGDTNGIGYEVIIKNLSNSALLEVCTPVVYGSSKVMNYHRKGMGLPFLQLNTLRDASEVAEGCINMMECCRDEVKVELGKPGKQAGEAAFMALEAATRDLIEGKIDVMVTAPINKDNIQSEQFTFPGHTEYLEQCLGEEGDKALMVMCSDVLRVALATIHIPLREVANHLSINGIAERLRSFDSCLKRDFDIQRPRIAVLALNPHAGDNGLLGKEEKEIIEPAIQQAAEKYNVMAFGPYSADGFFGNGHYRRFDGILAMYHDQGLIPFKTLSSDGGVNFTAGLNRVRTSPDHGTGYDIAGQGIAREASLREAIYRAIDIWRNRARWDEMYRNPLKKQYVNKGRDNVVLDLTAEEE